MSKEKNIFDSVFNRLLELGISSQKELAGILGVTRGAISGARQRGVFPKRWAVILSQTYNKSVEWLLGLEKYKEEETTIKILTERLEEWKKESMRKELEQKAKWENMEKVIAHLENQFLFLQRQEAPSQAKTQRQAG